MTRPVEIPEAAVEAAAQQLHPTLWDGQPGNRHAESARADARERVRLVLSAALPYLVPAEADLVVTKEAHDFLAGWKYDDVRISTDEAIAETMRLMKPSTPPAPAGDGGLRHDLEQLADLYEAEGKQADDGVSHHRIVGGLRRLLAAHPAAPAVPQPVDREALSAAVYEKSAAVVLDGGYITTLIAPEDAADAVLAVLAGEQEQARG